MKRVLRMEWMVLLILTGCAKSVCIYPELEKQSISSVLNSWHQSAAQADFEKYFSYMADSSIFIGTDATENWNKNEFMTFARPYFNRGKAWNFTSMQRNVFLNNDCNLAWFDELLQTQMKICRGSGVMEKDGKNWKIKHYVLSMTIPNENVDTVVRVKAPIEDSLMLKLNLKSKGVNR